GLPARQHLAERALAGAVGPHDGVHLAGADGEVAPREDLLLAHAGVQPPDLHHRLLRGAHPTLPSRLTVSSFCASTANSIGSSLKTFRQNPFTIIETASSSPIPRDRQ